MSKEKLAAIECLKEILESYIEFADYVSKNADDFHIGLLANNKKELWQPELDKIKHDLKEISNDKNK
ncbi:MAG: hypothetical protein ACTSP4_00850 [Candidatus Hodarchaeales archaeon]